MPDETSPAPEASATGLRQTLSTRSVPEAQRFEYWNDLICSLYVRLDCVPPKDAGIFGDVEFSSIGNLQFTQLRSNATSIRRTPEKIRRDTEDYCLILIQREGRGALLQDGRTGVMNPGDFLLNDCTRPYELRFDGPLHDVYVLRLPRKELVSHVGNLEALCATTVSGQSGAGHLLLNMVDTLRGGAANLHPASALGVSEAIASVIGAGLRSLPDANLRKNSNLAAYHLARIRSYVLEHIRDPDLSIGTVAHAVKLSPDHLSRLFRNEPLPLSRLIWQQRLEGCRRELADLRLAERSVSDIAFSWGFSDAAHFSRSFREQYDMSPRDWRATQLAGRGRQG